MTTFDAAEAVKALERIANALEREKENVSAFSPADVEDLLNQFEAILERRTEDFMESLLRNLECILTKAQEDKEKTK